MNREIKFRYFKDEKMSQPFTIFDIQDDLGRTYLIGFGRVYEGDGYLMQYTGLKDKNEKEIYEGDIVRFILDNSPIDETLSHGIGKVSYKVDSFGVETPLGLLKPTDILFNSWEEFEVIGNIYENPELLA